MLPGLYEELHVAHEGDLALSAFKQMVQWNVSGLAVVDAKGQLIDNISVRELRGMGATAEQWQNLWLSVKDFKQMW